MPCEGQWSFRKDGNRFADEAALELARVQSAMRIRAIRSRPSADRSATDMPYRRVSFSGPRRRIEAKRPALHRSRQPGRNWSSPINTKFGSSPYADAEHGKIALKETARGSGCGPPRCPPRYTRGPTGLPSGVGETSRSRSWGDGRDHHTRYGRLTPRLNAAHMALYRLGIIQAAEPARARGGFEVPGWQP